MAPFVLASAIFPEMPVASSVPVEMLQRINDLNRELADARKRYEDHVSRPVVIRIDAAEQLERDADRITAEANEPRQGFQYRQQLLEIAETKRKKAGEHRDAAANIEQAGQHHAAVVERLSAELAELESQRLAA